MCVSRADGLARFLGAIRLEDYAFRKVAETDGTEL